MSTRDPLPPMPDLGEPKVFAHPSGDPELGMWNVALSVLAAREAGTPEGERVYRAFVAAWDRIRDLPGNVSEMQSMALEEALASIGVGCNWTDYREELRGKPLVQH